MPETYQDQKFAELAHSALQLKAPTLVPLIAGFQTVHTSEDNSRAIGMFGITLGEKLIFIPVFFLKGTLKPLTIMFDYSANHFLPFTNSWVQYIMKYAKTSLGEASLDPKGGFSLFRAPNTDAQSSVGLQKAGSILDKMACYTASVLGSKIPRYLSECPTSEKRAFVKMLHNEKFAQLIDEKVGLTFVKQALAASTKIEPGVEQEDVPATVDGGVEVVTVDDRKNIKAIKDKLPTADAAKELMQKGYYIDDRRKATAVLYNTQYKSQFMNPSRPGEYSVILEDGTLTRAVVLTSPHMLSENQAVKDTCYVILPGSGRIATDARPSEVYVAPVRRSEDSIEKFLGKTVSAKSMVPSKRYLLVTPDLRCSGIFEVCTTRSTPSGAVHYTVRSSRSWDKASLMVGLASAEWFKKVGNEVIVPAKAVAYEVPGCEVCPLRLGTIGDLSNNLVHTGLEPVLMTHDGVEYTVGDQQKVDKVGAVKKLLMRYGISKQDTEDLMGKVASDYSVSFLVKKAQPTPVNYTTNSDKPYALIPAPMPQEQVPQISEQLHLSTQDPYLTINDVDRAATAGPDYLPALSTKASQFDNNVFDASVLLSLAQVADPSDLILSYLPDLELALDKLGRMLFMLWWKYDYFKESYSPVEISSMEADLREMLIKMGDMTLRLKRRATCADK